MNTKQKITAFLAGCLALSLCRLPANAETALRGDLNCDGTVSMADAVLLMRYVTEDSSLKLSPAGIANADVDLDDLLTVLDVASVLEHCEENPAETTVSTTVTTVTTMTTVTTSLTTPYTDYNAFSPADIPPYSSAAYVTVNQNQPYFSLSHYSTAAFEYYSPLDVLGRCGSCIACVGQELMPTEPRGSIGSVKPTGWYLVRYDGIVEGNYLYNRCHLLGYQLTAENANVCNLITGTRYLNVTGMLPFENQTANYIEQTGNHVIYRVTPFFENDNLVADGVLMEAQSVEDSGAGLQFNVFCYNVQPHIHIDYATGESRLMTAEEENPTEQPPADYDYVVNLNTKKFHKPDCSYVSDMSETAKWLYAGSRDSLLEQGYTPCKRCNP